MKCVCKLHTLNKKCSLEKEDVIILATQHTGIPKDSHVKQDSALILLTRDQCFEVGMRLFLSSSLDSLGSPHVFHWLQMCVVEVSQLVQSAAALPGSLSALGRKTHLGSESCCTSQRETSQHSQGTPDKPAMTLNSVLGSFLLRLDLWQQETRGRRF